MAAPKAHNVRFSSGKVVKDPTNLSIAYPYGGTELGLVGAVLWKPGVKSRQHGAEEWGGAYVESTFIGEVAMLALTLRGFDPDALARVFPNTSTGAVTGRTGIDGKVSGGTVVPGYRMTGRAFKLLLVPDDIEEDEGIILYSAIPGVEETAAMAQSITEEWGVPVFFLGAPDATGRVYAQKHFDDLVL